MAQILDGRKASEEIIQKVTAKAAVLAKNAGRVPGLAAVLVGDDPASVLYVEKKQAACRKAGFYSELVKFPSTITQEQLLDRINELNHDDRIDGILVQLPLPNSIDEPAILAAVSPGKDVDGFHPESQGKLLLGLKTLVPATPKGVVALLKHYDVEIEGKHVVIIGRTNIVGKPLMVLLLRENATVTICHSKTRNLAEITRIADILVSAVGKPNFITKEFVSQGVVAVDVGISRVNGKVCGDFAYSDVAEKASWITPVPGGVGPMTIAMLLENTLEAFEEKLG